MNTTIQNAKLQKLLKGNFSEEDIKRVISVGHDKATTVKELWAMWFAVHCMNDEEFIGERLDELTSKQQKFILTIVKNEHKRK